MKIQKAKKLLTIVIPTYNRKDRLLRQLKSLHDQGHYDLYKLVILDNCSDYDLQSAIDNAEYNPDFKYDIRIERRTVNTRMGYNLAGPLLFLDTKWIWIISDDDISTSKSIETVITYAEKYPSASLIKFQFTYHRHFDDILVSSVAELENSFREKTFTPGDLFYVGNNLINTEVLYNYLGDAFEHSSHLIPFVLPALHQLADGRATIVFSDQHVQTYVPNKSGDTWMKIPTILKFAELFDIKWGDFNKTWRIFRIICNHFMVSEITHMLLQEDDIAYRRYAYKRIRKTIFARPQSLKEHLFWVAYVIEDRFHIPSLSKILPLVKKYGFRKN